VNSRWVRLDGPTPVLDRINVNFDTIYFPSDIARPSRTYRITYVDDVAHTVTVDGAGPSPVFDGGSSHWHIPAGLSGELPPPTTPYNLGPDPPGVAPARGYDHYEGLLFMMYGGRVRRRIRWSSYTSRNYPTGSEDLSSIRGNREYDYYSFRSARSHTTYSNCYGNTVGRPFRNYSFKVVDALAVYDGVGEARFYFSTPVGDDSAPPGTGPAYPGLGKTEIRLHYGQSTNPNGGTGSAGCAVSPHYYDLVNELIDIYQAEHNTFHGAIDNQVNKLHHLNHARAMDLYEGCIQGGLTDANWNDKLTGTLWIIRPDERPSL
jgi:hypothetical protein